MGKYWYDPYDEVIRRSGPEGASDEDGLDEENLAVYINDTVYTKQEAEVFSEFDYYGTYENMMGKYGIKTSAIRHYFEYRFIRPAGHCMNQFRAGSLVWNPGSVINNIATKYPVGTYNSTDKDMSGMIVENKLRNNVSLWNPPYIWTRFTNGTWVSSARIPGSLSNSLTQDPKVLIVSETNIATSGRAMGVYHPNSEINNYQIIGVKKTDGSIYYTDKRPSATNALNWIDSFNQYLMNNIGWNSTITGMINPARLPSGIYEAYREESYIFYGTPQDIMNAVAAFEANYIQTQTISFWTLPVKKVGDADFSPGANTNSGLTITYASSNPAVATISTSGNIQILSAGTTDITATQAGNSAYLPANSAKQTLTVVSAQQAQAISFPAMATKNYGTFDFSPASTSSGLPVSYTSTNPSVATIVSGQIHIAGVGTTSIVASQAGNSAFAAASSITQTLTVVPNTQQIYFEPIDSATVGDTDIKPASPFTATAFSSSGLALTFTSTNPSVATITSGGLIHIVAPGTTNIIASQAGNSNYLAATSVSRPITVVAAGGLFPQTILFDGPITKFVGDADFSPAGCISGQKITLTSTNTRVANIPTTPYVPGPYINAYVHIMGVGTTTITASIAGNSVFSPASSVSQTLTVLANGQAQTISFPALATKITGDADFSPGATASSGLLIVYTSSDPTVASIVNGNIHIIKAGTTTITASQGGNTNYKAATSVSQVLTVNQGISGVDQVADNYSFEIYPNPARDNVTIKSEDGKCALSVYNSMGSLVYSIPNFENQITIPTSKIGGKGVYFVRANYAVKKLIVGN